MSAPQSIDGGAGGDVSHSSRSIRGWAAMLVRVMTSGLLHADLQRARRHKGLARSDIETLALIHRAFGKRHS
jgi:hypothetical protein